MRTFAILALAVLMAAPSLTYAQQLLRLPNLESMKHITTRDSEHATDIPGKETAMNFYSGPGGLVYTVYAFRGRTIAFSTHSNSDPQKSYRVYMDLAGKGLFQQINSGPWQVPAWARR